MFVNVSEPGCRGLWRNFIGTLSIQFRRAKTDIIGDFRGRSILLKKQVHLNDTRAYSKGKSVKG